ncbi:MAG: hypothetical protein ACOH1O_05195 [Flavobacterium sp.]
MKKSFYILVLFSVLLSCNRKKEIDNKLKNESNQILKKTTVAKSTEIPKVEKIEFEPYDFDTILKNNFHLSYRVYEDTTENGILQSLTLVKGKKDIKQISETSYPMLHKNLGYIGADYGSSFLFVQSYGSGNPNEIQLIKKENGEIITEGVLVDQNEIEKVILYIKNEHQENEKLILLDLKYNNEKVLTDFNNVECSHIGGLRNCVEIDTITKNQITIKTNSENSIKTKKYNR